MCTGGGEAVASLSKDLHQVVGQISAGQIQTEDGVRQSVTLVDGHSVADTVTGVHHNTCKTKTRLQKREKHFSDVTLSFEMYLAKVPLMATRCRSKSSE